MARRTALIAILILVNLTPAQAAWSPLARQWAEKYAADALFPSGDAASVWASVQARKELFGKPAHEHFEVPAAEFEAGSVPVSLSVRKTADGKTIHAPLIVFLPGIFNSSEDPFSLRAIDNFSRRGTHVLVIPNAWGDEYLAHRPKFHPGSLESEASVALEVIADAERRIGRENVTDTRIVGESYGGFLAAVAAVKDSRAPTRLITGPVTILGAPIDLARAVKNLDAGILATHSRFRRECSGTWRHWRIIAELLWRDRESGFSEMLAGCSSPLLYDAFHGLLERTAWGLHRNEGREGPVIVPGFLQFIQRYTPENLRDLTSGVRSAIGYWLRQIPPEMDVRVMVARDDFLNQGAEWNSLVPWALPANRLIVLPWGGHVGFVGVPAFQEFLDHAF